MQSSNSVYLHNVVGSLFNCMVLTLLDHTWLENEWSEWKIILITRVSLDQTIYMLSHASRVYSTQFSITHFIHEFNRVKFSARKAGSISKQIEANKASELFYVPLTRIRGPSVLEEGHRSYGQTTIMNIKRMKCSFSFNNSPPSPYRTPPSVRSTLVSSFGVNTD